MTGKRLYIIHRWPSLADIQDRQVLLQCNWTLVQQQYNVCITLSTDVPDQKHNSLNTCHESIMAEL